MTTPTPSLRAFDELAANRRSQRGTPVPQLSLDQIGPLPGQPRQSFDPEALAELAESIKTHGVIQPIIVIARKDISDTDPVRYRIVCGERRYQACRLAGLNAVPALIRDYYDDEVAVLALLENLQREDLTPLEEGEYLLQLKQKYGFTEEQLGERLGKSRDYVHMRTRLMNLSPDILAAWKQAASTSVFTTLTPSHAILVNQLGDPDLRHTLTADIIATGITVAETRRRLEMIKQLESEADWLPPDSLAKLQLGAVKGMPASEFAMRLSGYKKRLEAVPAGAGPGPLLAAQDLAVFALVEKLVRSGETQLALRELEAALKKDMAWVRKITREGLADG
jgi:ParB family chromosome partitioning protein